MCFILQEGFERQWFLEEKQSKQQVVRATFISLQSLRASKEGSCNLPFTYLFCHTKSSCIQEHLWWLIVIKPRRCCRQVGSFDLNILMLLLGCVGAGVLEPGGPILDGTCIGLHQAGF